MDAWKRKANEVRRKNWRFRCVYATCYLLLAICYLQGGVEIKCEIGCCRSGVNGMECDMLYNMILYNEIEMR